MSKIDLSRVLITGADGMIGSQVPWGIHCNRGILDITNIEQVSIVVSHHNPTAILHLASIDIRACHADPLKASEVNIYGTLNVAKVAAKMNIPLAFISSGTIFSGPLEAEFSVRDHPSPKNIYGQTKFIGEEIIKSLISEYIIVRAGWVFGGHGAHHKKFVDTIAEKAHQGKPIEASEDQRGSPTYVLDFVSSLTQLRENRVSGVFNIVNRRSASAFEMATFLVDHIGSSSQVVSKSRFNFTTSNLHRSASEVLVPNVDLRSWHDSLASYLGSNPI